MEWLAIIPDHANALSKRMEVRPTHLDQLPPDIAAGQIVFGGAILSAQPTDGQAPPMKGSVILFKDMTEDEVRERIKNDPYTKGGVWDMDAVQIIPFKTAFRIGT